MIPNLDEKEVGVRGCTRLDPPLGNGSEIVAKSLNGNSRGHQ